MARAQRIRVAALCASGLISLGAGWLYMRFIGSDGTNLLDWFRTSLFTLTSFWLVWGGVAGVLGVLAPPKRRLVSAGKPEGMTAILMPIYNEDAAASFSRVAAMNRSLVSLGIADRFHFAILSDTNRMEVAAEEVVWFEQLLQEPMAEGRMYYRRRERNVGKKAGNIEDFISRSGAAYDYALILDADSLMDGATIQAMARRMDEDKRLGLLQTVPEVIHARSMFGRLMQFSAAYLSPFFARGTSLMQGEEGPYWGHNAIVRMQAFAASCGLPVLSGKPPAGGHILSHDYVEAALLSRAGWKVEVDPYLGGSYEEGPENLIEYAKRDRRWCQGNLQHRRLLGAPGLRFWSRFTFVQGIMAYVASPLWLMLLAASILAEAIPGRYWWRDDETGIWVLAVAVAVVLLLPKLLILLRSTLGGRNAGFGGTLRAGASVLAEILVSTLLAPIMLCFQSKAVIEILLGLDGGWPATNRSESRVSLPLAFAASWWVTVAGAGVLAISLVFARDLVPWLIPVALPAILAPLLIAWTSNGSARKPLLFTTTSETAPAPVIVEQQRIYLSWTHQGPVVNEPSVAGVSRVHA
ncbi:glucans biosynthesis glucosyltransferase MdoH [Devosia sp. ZB163]|uniref:glucans biosynthesis glucosyltransferase MdoH n=1 Tax=Devosia sp. ZB163 TaxID=3025938 RepID=UPI0023612EC5|nr:glucans biosynthesis glucosyltransferase MdoH [Devosia sp. ZB163]MDC9823374.1 glucans biosynthesis glucosyltransferase MdoH [Devosia sp. ZB163]